MISTAIELDFQDGLKDKVIKHHKSLKGNHLAQEVLTRLVVDHLYMYHVDHKIKDKTMDKLGIRKDAQNNINAKKSAKFSEGAINYKK